MDWMRKEEGKVSVSHQKNTRSRDWRAQLEGAVHFNCWSLFLIPENISMFITFIHDMNIYIYIYKQ